MLGIYANVQNRTPAHSNRKNIILSVKVDYDCETITTFVNGVWKLGIDAERSKIEYSELIQIGQEAQQKIESELNSLNNRATDLYRDAGIIRSKIEVLEEQLNNSSFNNSSPISE